MDLSLLKDNLADYATFGKNVGTALQSIPTLLNSILDFFTNFSDNADTTGDAFKGLSS
ncbi:PorH family porin [Corynebacterium glutamicum]|uniref:PorH family porin n=1 Tax=Corynebacterium glutamicum TaxID=1718 RepID=UPI000AE6D6F6|nr:PorH family porin [Corynebacterium glutamicum]